jgi:hypothetical protein
MYKRKFEKIANGMKICTKCKEVKTLDEFCRESKCKDGRSSRCRKCQSEAHKIYYAKKKLSSENNVVKIIQTLPEGKKKCTICEEIKDLNEFYTVKSSGTKISYCNKCNCKRRNESKNKSEKNFLSHLWHTVQNRCKDKDKKTDLSREFLQDLYDSQEGRCWYSNIEMTMKTFSNWKCSVERLDPSGWYTRDNVKLIVSELNVPAQWTKESLKDFILEEEVVDDVPIDEILDHQTKKRKLPEEFKKRAVICDGSTRQQYCCTRCHEWKEFSDMEHCHGHALPRCRKCKNIITNVEGQLIKLMGNAKKDRNKCGKARGEDPFEFNITLEHLKDIYRGQNGRCYYSGKVMEYGNDARKLRKMSIERLNVRQGYVIGNVALICMGFNSFDQTNRVIPGEVVDGSSGMTKEKFQILKDSVIQMYK